MEIPKHIINRTYAVRGSVVLSKPGSVIKVGHEKFLLVVGNSLGNVHLCVINSKPFRLSSDGSQVKISKEDLSALSHDSFVDCTKVRNIPEKEFLNAISSGIFIPKGHLSETAMAYVQKAGLNCRELSQFEKEFFV